MLYDYLIENYKPGEPIFSVDIEINDLSEDNLRRQLKQLTDSKRLVRYANGIYYMEKQSKLNGKVSLDAETVAKCKYIERRGKRVGYYAGNTLANQMGISMQVPIKEEIVSNYMSAIVREVEIGNRVFVVRKPKVEVNEGNYKVLQLLEILKELDSYCEGDFVNAKRQLESYIKVNQIRRDEVDRFIDYYPLQTYKFIYTMRLEHVFA